VESHARSLWCYILDYIISIGFLLNLWHKREYMRCSDFIIRKNKERALQSKLHIVFRLYNPNRWKTHFPPKHRGKTHFKFYNPKIPNTYLEQNRTHKKWIGRKSKSHPQIVWAKIWVKRGSFNVDLCMLVLLICEATYFSNPLHL